jgi:hypothetical protein
MQDHSHKLLFLGLTGLMSVAALYGSEAGPTLLVSTDGAQPAVSASLNRSEGRASPVMAAKLAPQSLGCPGTAHELSSPCAAKSEISLSSP